MSKKPVYTSPLIAIRKHCAWCCGSSSAGEKNHAAGCNSQDCPLYTRRFGKKVGAGALKAIRLRCLECVGSSPEVKNCQEEECDLFMYRFGHNPRLAGRGASAERMRVVTRARKEKTIGESDTNESVRRLDEKKVQ